MSLPKIEKIRLATSGTIAPETFNFYQLVSVFSSLYFKAGDRADIRENKGWDEANHSLLTQVGEAFVILELAQVSAKEHVPLQPNLELTARVARLALRMLKCEEHLNTWTPQARWTRILLMLEKKMKRVCEQIAAYNPYISAEIHEFIGLGGKRTAFVANLNEEAVREAESLQASFAIPQAM